MANATPYDARVKVSTVAASSLFIGITSFLAIRYTHKELLCQALTNSAMCVIVGFMETQIETQLLKFRVMGIRFCAAHCRLLASVDPQLRAAEVALIFDDLADSIEKSDAEYQRAQEEDK